MKLFIVLLGLSSLVLAELLPPHRPYRILFLLPMSTKSHRILHLSLATALADRGHKITMLTNHPPVAKHPGVYEFTHGFPELRFDDRMDVFELRRKVDSAYGDFISSFKHLARELYQHPQVKDVYTRRKEFDLIVVDSLMNDAVYPFVHEMPFITLCGLGLEEMQSAVMGNVINPSYTPNVNLNYHSPMTFLQRVLNVFMYVAESLCYRKLIVLPPVQSEISKQFPWLPDLEELERNLSLTLLNSHHSVDMVQPLLPSQVEVGSMHCRPAEPLPQDLAEWINGAEHGVIYFSLGSVIRGSSMPLKYRNIFVKAFARMEQRIIMQFDDKLEGVSKNVLIRKWLPQQDILGHPKVKVFITHGGRLSLQEAIYHSTPMVALPVFFDQPKVAAQIQRAGFGISLVWEELTVHLFVKTLDKVINNPKYAKAVGQASIILRDQKETPLDRAIWWTEYVIRHQGAQALRCPGASLSWVEFLCLDVLFLVYVLVIAMWWGAKKLTRKSSSANK